jgi:hypothetical protein
VVHYSISSSSPMVQPLFHFTAPLLQLSCNAKLCLDAARVGQAPSPKARYRTQPAASTWQPPWPLSTTSRAMTSSIIAAWLGGHHGVDDAHLVVVAASSEFRSTGSGYSPSLVVSAAASRSTAGLPGSAPLGDWLGTAFT